MSAAINQFGLHTIEYAIRKKRLEDPLYIAAHPESLPTESRRSMKTRCHLASIDFPFSSTTWLCT